MSVHRWELAQSGSFHQTSKKDVSRFLGLVLGGAKSERTCLCVIDYYKNQKKAFLVDVFESISADDKHTGDQALLQLVDEAALESDSGIQVLATDAPLTLPPCFVSCERSCNGYEKCAKKSVRWMQKEFKKAKIKNDKLKHFTPYTQRPVELYYRYKFSEVFQDETLGANLAPQTARMQYLQRYLRPQMDLIEVWPKLVLFTSLKQLKMTKRDLLLYRSIDEGQLVRERLLEKMIERFGFFVYERDFKKLVTSIPAFEAFICAWMAMLHAQGKTEAQEAQLPVDTGWVQVPGF